MLGSQFQRRFQGVSEEFLGYTMTCYKRLQMASERLQECLGPETLKGYH